jgi:hypothetical protein
MKALLAMILLAPWALAAPREIDRGDTTRDTKVFESKHPYTITWALTPPKPLYKGDKPDETVTVFVYEAAGDKPVVSKLRMPWNGSLKVPKGGKHYFWISTECAWIMRIEENPPNPHDEAVIRQLRAERDAREAREAEDRRVAREASDVPAPKPSSVPGLPDGVEPAKKKAAPALPPGMTKGK